MESSAEQSARCHFVMKIKKNNKKKGGGGAGGEERVSRVVNKNEVFDLCGGWGERWIFWRGFFLKVRLLVSLKRRKYQRWNVTFGFARSQCCVGRTVSEKNTPREVQVSGEDAAARSISSTSCQTA